jgi:NAD(P)H-dependent FMN reductase
MTSAARLQGLPQSRSIAVLLGSMRSDRMGPRAAKLVTRELERRGHVVHLVDPLELQLPVLDRMYNEHPAGEAPDHLESLAALYRSVDGFLVVSGEYNHGIPPALKNLSTISSRSISFGRRVSCVTRRAASAVCARRCSCA